MLYRAVSPARPSRGWSNGGQSTVVKRRSKHGGQTAVKARWSNGGQSTVVKRRSEHGPSQGKPRAGHGQKKERAVKLRAGHGQRNGQTAGGTWSKERSNCGRTVKLRSNCGQTRVETNPTAVGAWSKHGQAAAETRAVKLRPNRSVAWLGDCMERLLPARWLLLLLLLRRRLLLLLLLLCLCLLLLLPSVV